MEFHELPAGLKKHIINPSIIDFSDIISHLVCKDSIWSKATISNALRYILAEFSSEITQMKKLRDPDLG